MNNCDNCGACVESEWDFDKMIAELDIARDQELNKNRIALLAFIDRVEKPLKKQSAHEMKMFRRCREYVTQYAWLPGSYRFFLIDCLCRRHIKIGAFLDLLRAIYDDNDEEMSEFKIDEEIS